MCGIVGYITTNIENYQNARRGFLQYALMLDTLRGPDSTGVITVSKKFTVNRFKTLGSGFRMATSPQFDNVPNGWCAIGHNRAATIGDVTVDNAHPFKFGKVSLVHNGTLRNDGRNLPSYDKKLNVDSMQVAKALAEVVPKKAPDILEQIDGDFCLVWTDERDRTINMARNRGRPMHLGFNWDRSLMVFMSDDEHLQVLTKAFSNTTASIPTIYALDSFQHLKWKRGNLRPEVVDFRPFAQRCTGMVPHNTPTGGTTKTTHTEKSSSQSRTKRDKAAQRKADRKWRKWQDRNLEKSTTVEHGAGSLSLINRQISEYDGLVPKTNTPGMLEALEGFFATSPSNFTSFKPEDFYELTDNLFHVVGSTTAQGWGGVEWEGVINFVNKKQVEAYGDGLWLVRPIGLTRNRSIPGCPAILCDLVHCDYEKYEQSIKEEQAGIAMDIVKDPSGRLISRAKLEKMMESGCINCQAPLNVEDSYSYEMVNNEQDIVCEDCKWEEKWPLA